MVESMRLVGRYSTLKAALQKAEYDLVEQELVPNLRAAVVLRNGWLHVGTLTPVGDFGASELVLHSHNNTPEQMLAVATHAITAQS